MSPVEDHLQAAGVPEGGDVRAAGVFGLLGAMATLPIRGVR